MPPNHGVGSNDGERTAGFRTQVTNPTQEHSVDDRKRQTARFAPSQHNDLLSQHQNLSFQCCPRPVEFTAFRVYISASPAEALSVGVGDRETLPRSRLFHLIIISCNCCNDGHLGFRRLVRPQQHDCAVHAPLMERSSRKGPSTHAFKSKRARRTPLSTATEGPESPRRLSRQARSDS